MQATPQNHFAAVAPPPIQRSKFDSSFTHKTTMNDQYLYPLFCREVLPGQTMQMNMAAFARFATLIFPIMDNAYFEGHFFFVPNRLTWDNWVRFCGEQDDPDDTTDYLIPVINPGTDPAIQFAEESLQDYLGLPTKMPLINDPAGGTPSGIDINALPMRAYKLIWNTWYRDENLQNTQTLDKGDGPDDVSAHILLKRGKRKDYVTSSLPWPQKGDAVILPLGDTAPVVGNGIALGLSDGTTGLGLYSDAGPTDLNWNEDAEGVPIGLGLSPNLPPTGGLAVGVTNNPANSGLIARLDLATGATINAWRQAYAFQSMLELDARGGTRYTEILRAHFHVVPEDARLQRPEYLGGFSQRVDVKQVAQTTPTPAEPGPTDTPQANLAAFGQLGANCEFMKSFPEHGYVLGLFNLRTDITYQQFIHRMWSRQTRNDFYWPSLAHLGEQSVLNKEVAFFSDETDPDLVPNAVWGYQERWSEYKYGQNMVTGKMRSNATGSLEAWHFATEFGSMPVLGPSFIFDQPPIARTIAVPSEPYLIVDLRFGVFDTLPMPTYNTPANLMRF